MPRPEPDGDRLLTDLDHLASIGASRTGGVTRIAFSPADLEARDWLETQLRELQLDVRHDAAGNTIGRYPGRSPGLHPLALGSHTDTVPEGGRFDGALGVLAALASVRALHDAGVQLRHPVEVIDFVAEEATLGPGTLGSRAMVGRLGAEQLAEASGDGRSIADRLQAAGLDPRGVAEAARPPGSLAAYLELHIEQGGTLEREGVAIGIVEGIVGIRRYAATFTGQANHAGTTPMAERRDALVMAAPFVLGLREAVERAGIVGTIGALRLEPNAPNVIPGRVELSAEIRGLDEPVLDRVEAELADLAAAHGGGWRRLGAKEPVRSDPGLMAALEAACDDLGLGWRRMPSGAGHDAVAIAAIAPVAMLFVPSRGGISHSPEEHTEAQDCVNGARALLRALLEVDARLDRE
jgi:beta-ureidopropionase / N-carbamoyl-L-amino-acid hydrolase